MVFSEAPLPEEVTRSHENGTPPLMDHLVIIPETHEHRWTDDAIQTSLTTLANFADRNGIAVVTICLDDTKVMPNRTIDGPQFRNLVQHLTTSDNPPKTKVRIKTTKGREEILDAIRFYQIHGGTAENLTEDVLDDLIDKGIPDPDFILYTGVVGEDTISSEADADEVVVANFMTWQTAYSEFGKTNVSFLGMSDAHMQSSIADEYRSRERPMGGKRGSENVF